MVRNTWQQRVLWICGLVLASLTVTTTATMAAGGDVGEKAVVEKPRQAELHGPRPTLWRNKAASCAITAFRLKSGLDRRLRFSPTAEWKCIVRP